MRRLEDLQPWKTARLQRRAADLERHLKAAFQIAGQAHLQATAKSSPEMILELIKTAQAELGLAEIALAKVRP